LISSKVSELSSSLDMAGRENGNALLNVAKNINNSLDSVINVTKNETYQITPTSPVTKSKQINQQMSNKQGTGFFGILTSGVNVMWEGIKEFVSGVWNVITTPPGSNILPEPNVSRIQQEHVIKTNDIQQPQSVNISIANANINGVSQVHING